MRKKRKRRVERSQGAILIELFPELSRMSGEAHVLDGHLEPQLRAPCCLGELVKRLAFWEGRF